MFQLDLPQIGSFVIGAIISLVVIGVFGFGFQQLLLWGADLSGANLEKLIFFN
jgi:hypothetical protein